MQNFSEYLRSKEVSDDLMSVLETLEESVKQISCSIIGGHCCKNAGSVNSSGEEQIALDLQSDEIITNEISKNSYIGLIASEEKPGEERVGRGEFAVCYDPLDGSSLVDVNLAVGSIFGIYKAESFIGVRGDDQLASMIAVYGPRTTILLTVKSGVVEFSLNKDGEFELVRDDLKVESGKMFAPGNLRACAFREDYKKLLAFWCENQYTLRYSGGMVPDVNQIILKGKGVFSYPAYEETPEGKLRLLFECAPMALLMEEAGGKASDGRVRILEKEVSYVHERTPVFLGSKEEVERCDEYLG
ncbi:fructose-bisphosphatase class I [Candidatus Peregrinibacteria bacterium]|nr:fructose-bisphosphatase class I [Candidatus Peregrinibacteria bacterium]